MGAVSGGILADLFTIQSTVLVIAGLTAVSGAVTFFLLPETVAKNRRPETGARLLVETVGEPNLSETP